MVTAKKVPQFSIGLPKGRGAVAGKNLGRVIQIKDRLIPIIPLRLRNYEKKALMDLEGLDRQA